MVAKRPPYFQPVVDLTRAIPHGRVLCHNNAASHWRARVLVMVAGSGCFHCPLFLRLAGPHPLPASRELRGAPGPPARRAARMTDRDVADALQACGSGE